MLRQHVAGQEAAVLLPGARLEDGPQGFPPGALQGLPAPRGDTPHVRLAMPPGLRPALRGVRQRVRRRYALITPPEEHATPGLRKALPVSLVKPVAYPLLISY
jgi:hypothetical protein